MARRKKIQFSASHVCLTLFFSILPFLRRCWPRWNRYCTSATFPHTRFNLVSSLLSLLFYSFLFARNRFQHAVKWCHFTLATFFAIFFHLFGSMAHSAYVLSTTFFSYIRHLHRASVPLFCRLKASPPVVLMLSINTRADPLRCQSMQTHNCLFPPVSVFAAILTLLRRMEYNPNPTARINGMAWTSGKKREHIQQLQHK